MQRLEISGAVRPLYGSLGVKGLIDYMQHNTINLISVVVKFLLHWKVAFSTSSIEIQNSS